MGGLREAQWGTAKFGYEEHCTGYCACCCFDQIRWLVAHLIRCILRLPLVRHPLTRRRTQGPRPSGLSSHQRLRRLPGRGPVSCTSHNKRAALRRLLVGRPSSPGAAPMTPPNLAVGRAGSQFGEAVSVEVTYRFMGVFPALDASRRETCLLACPPSCRLVALCVLGGTACGWLQRGPVVSLERRPIWTLRRPGCNRDGGKGIIEFRTAGVSSTAS